MTRYEKREYDGEGVRRILCGGKLADDEDGQDLITIKITTISFYVSEYN